MEVQPMQPYRAPALRRALNLAATFLKFLIMFEQGDQAFILHWALQFV